jgi:formate dehydrogenase major subunit
MTRRATILDAIEPEAVASLSPADFATLGLKPGGIVRVATRRGEIVLKARRDTAVPKGMVFVPFCFTEAAANLLTHPQLDPFGKIPEFKYCEARVEVVSPQLAAAE